jgi:chromosomal replication initiator protein
MPDSATPAGGTATPAAERWAPLEAHLRARLRADLFERWFAPLRPTKLDGAYLEVSAPDKFHRDFVDDNYRSLLDDLVTDLFGRRLDIAFVSDDRHPPPGDAGPGEEVGLPDPCERPAPARDAESPRESRANPRYTFDAFVVGESNRFAFAAAQAVASRPGKNYNPLFVHGDSGLGKTHLLHAIAHEIVRRSPDSRVAIVSSEQYTNEFVEALSHGAGSMIEFRRKYRECGALLVDDVQFLAGRDKTAEEFFHTFNALHEHEVQIVLSSDHRPKELDGLQDRLCSRFEWGMRVQIDAPEFETRAAILRKKAEVEGVDLPDSVGSLLAKYIRSNVRELEGALMRLVAFSSLKKEPISENLARRVLGYVIPPPGYKPSIERIQEEVAKYYDLTVAKLTSQSREQKIALPRQIAMYLCRLLACETLQQIAGKFNKKDHTTVMAAEKRVRETITSDAKVADDVAALTTKLSV